MSLILSIGLARYFVDKEIFGKYQQILVIVNFFLTFASGIPVGLSFFYGRYLEFSKRIKLFKRFWWTIVFSSLIFAILSLVLRSLISRSFNNEYFLLYAGYIIVLIVLKILNSFFLHFNLVKGKTLYHSVIVALTFVMTLFYVWLIYYYKLDTGQILLGLMIIEFIKLICFLKKLTFYLRIKGQILVTTQEMAYIGPLTAISLITTVSLYVDKLMISAMLSPKEFAIYQVGAFTIPFISIITGSVVTALIPLMSKLNSENNKKEIIIQLRNATEKTTLFLIPILVYCIVMGRFLITALYSENYASSGIIFQTYTGIYLLTVIAFSAIMNAVGLQNWIVVNAFINLTTNSVLNYILIPKFGAMGAVYATLISTYMGYFFPIYLLKKKLDAIFWDYFPTIFYMKVLGISVLIAFFFSIPFYLLNINHLFSILVSFPYFLIILLIFSGRRYMNMISLLFQKI